MDRLQKRWRRRLPALLNLMDVHSRAAASGSHQVKQMGGHEAAALAGRVARSLASQPRKIPMRKLSPVEQLRKGLMAALRSAYGRAGMAYAERAGGRAFRAAVDNPKNIRSPNRFTAASDARDAAYTAAAGRFPRVVRRAAGAVGIGAGATYGAHRLTDKQREQRKEAAEASAQKRRRGGVGAIASSTARAVNSVGATARDFTKMADPYAGLPLAKAEQLRREDDAFAAQLRAALTMPVSAAFR